MATKNSAQKKVIEDWETECVDFNERELAERVVKKQPTRPRPKRYDDEGILIELYAMRGHRWSPVSHYLEPYI